LADRHEDRQVQRSADRHEDRQVERSADRYDEANTRVSRLKLKCLKFLTLNDIFSPHSVENNITIRKS